MPNHKRTPRITSLPNAQLTASLIRLYRRQEQLCALAETLAAEIDALAEALGLPEDFVIRHRDAIETED